MKFDQGVKEYIQFYKVKNMERKGGLTKCGRGKKNKGEAWKYSKTSI